MAGTVAAGAQGEAISPFLRLIQFSGDTDLDEGRIDGVGLANGWRIIADHPRLTNPGMPNAPIVRLVLKATVVNLEVRKPAGRWEKVAGESYAHIVQGSEDEPPRGLGFEKIPSFSLLMQQNRDSMVFGRMSGG